LADLERCSRCWAVLQLIDYVGESVFLKDITCGASLNFHAIQDSSGSYQSA